MLMHRAGTLTKNDQTITEAYSVDETIHLDPSSNSPYTAPISPSLRKAMDIGALCNNASLTRNEDGIYVGQSTDVAFLNVLERFGLPDRRPVCPFLFPSNPQLNQNQFFIQHFERLSERPFNSEQKYMAVSGIHHDSGSSSFTVATSNGIAQEMYYIKGSIEAVLDRCKFYYVNDESTPGLDSSTRNVILSKAHSAASRGLRVIALAYGYGAVDFSVSRSRSLSRSRSASPVAGERGHVNLVFVGFQAMLDPPRRGVADSIGLLQAGGVQVVMITGDAEATALSIAQKLGLKVGRGAGVLTGKAIDQMTKGQLKERVGNVSVFARTTPRHKMAIVEAFQARGAVVAMTGDGGKF